MVCLTLEPTKEQKKTCNPIAIVKTDDNAKKNKLHNKLLYLDTREDAKGETEIDIPIGCSYHLIPNADDKKRDVYYIAGASGSGKSYLAKQLADNYQKLYEGRPVYVVSKLDEDETLDSMEIPPIRLDYKMFLDDPPNINDFNNCMVIFDDIDTIDGKYGKAVHTFAEDIATMGRRHTDGQGNITMLYITHAITNYKKTRTLLNESTNYIVYPNSSSPNQLRYLLMNYVGFDKEDLKGFKRLGRWVSIRKGFPVYSISQHRAKLYFIGDDL